MWRKILVLAWSGFVLCGCVATVPTQPLTREEAGPPLPFDRPQGAKVVLVVLENKNEEPARERPFLKRLASEGSYLANYHAVAHPSQPNYIAMVSGSIEGVTWGDRNVNLSGRCHLGKKLVRWMVYAEDYPGGDGTCFTDSKFEELSDGRRRSYVRKHVPFLSFDDINCNEERCIKNCTSHVRKFDAEKFKSDARTPNLPDFSLIIPNLDNDGHDFQGKPAEGSLSGKALDVADRWLSDNFEPLLSDPYFKQNVILIVTFDEDDANYPYRPDSNRDYNKVYTSFWGGHVSQGKIINTYYDHYDLHRTIEAILGVDESKDCSNVSGKSALKRNFAPIPIGGIWR